MGRRMKVSTIALSGSIDSFRLDRRAVGDLLHSGDDHAVAGFQTSADDVIVAEELADLHRPLPGNEAAVRTVFGDKAEVLPAYPRDGSQRDADGRRRAPDDAGADE